MRIFICRSLAFIAMGLISGCTSNTPTPSATHTEAVATTPNCVLQSGGADVLHLTAPAGTKCVTRDAALRIKAPEFDAQVWMANKAQSLDEAIAGVPTQIVDEFKDFKSNKTTDLTIAGSPAKRLVGAGHEADDGDPGAADVIVFKVAGHFFVACTHGESLTPVAQQGLLSLVQTAQ